MGKPKYLLVVTDDDGYGHPTFCDSETALREALTPNLYLFNEACPLSEEDKESVEAHLAELLEDGVLKFEGDPSIYLFKMKQD